MYMSSDISDSSKKLSEIDVVSSLNDDDFLMFERESESYKISYASFKNYVVECMSS